MTAELREQSDTIYVVDLACGLEEDWGSDRIGAGLRLDEHNEQSHPTTAAGVTEADRALQLG
jgi:hypothetical protein